MKIIVLGGGIGGLSTAIGLERNGFEVELYESASAFKPVGAGLALSPNAVYALKVLGVQEDVFKAAHPYQAAAMIESTGRVITAMDMQKIVAVTGERFITIHRHDLHQALAANLKATKVFFNKRCIKYEQSEQGISITFEDGTKAEAPFLIAADGIHSHVRKTLLPQASERYSGQTCWRGVCSNENMNYTQLSESWGRGKRFGIVPISNNRLYWFAVVDAPLKSDYSKYTKNQLIPLFSEFHAPVKQVLESTPQESIFWNDLNDLLPIKKYAFQNTLLLGDAAHATTPNMGQGACMAIEDAALLHVLTKQNKDLPNVFELFESKRINRCTGIVNQSYQFGQMAQWTNPIAMWLRNTLLRNTPASLTVNMYKKLFGYKVGA